MRLSISIVICSLASISLVSASSLGTQNYNPTGDGCIDPKGFVSCYADQDKSEVGCGNYCNSTSTTQSQYQQCILGCYYAHLSANMGCYYQSRWNMLYSCQYQLTALAYTDGKGLDASHNYGIPTTYPGSCSCNLVYVYAQMANITTETCPDGLAGLDTCECCVFFKGLSNILSSCPKSDLSVFAIDNYIAKEAGNLQPYLKGSQNCAILNSPTSCIEQYGMSFTGKVFNPFNLPAGFPGKGPLVNNPGNSHKPPYSTTVWSLFPYTSTITLAYYNGGGATGTAAVATSTGKQSSGVSAGTSTTTGTGTTATTTKSGGRGRYGNLDRTTQVMMLAAATLLLL